MATETRKITLTELGGDAGPNYSVFYSADCITYTASADCTNLYLPDVDSFGYCTVDDTAVCIKLVSKGTCTNEVIENPTLPTTTTTTISPTTTLPPSPTTTAAPTTSTTTVATFGPFQITAVQGDGQANSVNACAINVSWPFWSNETSVANITIGSKIYSTSGGADWFGESEWYGIGTGIGTASVKSIRIDNSGNVIDVYTCGSPTTSTTTIAPTTLAPTTTTLTPGTTWDLLCPSTAGGGCAYTFTKLDGTLCSDTAPPDTNTIFCVKSGTTPVVTGGVWTQIGDSCNFNSCLENP